MKDIKDYLHFYIDTNCLAKPNGIPDAEALDCKICNLPVVGTEIQMVDDDGEIFWSFLSDFKFVLRPLSSMTDQEKKECDKQIHKYEPQLHSHITDWAYRIDWLLKKGFDLFGLIEAGLAVNAATLKEKA